MARRRQYYYATRVSNATDEYSPALADTDGECGMMFEV